MAVANNGRNGRGRQPAPQVIPRVPFVSSAHEHIEPAWTTTVTPGANGVNHGPYDVPAYGFLRHIVIEVSGASGVLGAGVVAADYPWNLFERIALMDTNGSPIFELDGFAALQANIYGGYVFKQDPRNLSDYSAGINPVFRLRIPVEINHFDALGAISNQNSSANYQVVFRTRPSADLFSTAPTTIPTLTIKGWLEAWSVPNDTDLAGRPQAQLPPAHGTSQYWSSNNPGTVAGQNSIQIRRVGRMIRTLIFIARTSAGVRQDNVFPNPVSLRWDGNNIISEEDQATHIRNLQEKIVQGTRDTGVFAFPLSHSELGRAGDGPANLWYATVQSSRLEFVGTSVTAGAVQVVTNDIAPVEVQAADRYEFPSETGDNPVLGSPAVRVG